MKDRRSLTWKDIAMMLIPVLIAITGFLMKDLYAQVREKVDKTEFYKVVESQDKKSDLIIELIRDHMNSTRGSRRERSRSDARRDRE